MSDYPKKTIQHRSENKFTIDRPKITNTYFSIFVSFLPTVRGLPNNLDCNSKGKIINFKSLGNIGCLDFILGLRIREFE